MGKYDPRVDDYIAKSPAYAQPIMKHIRGLIHQAVPNIVEVIKWAHPHFEYKGPAFSIGAFKEHLGLNFWKSKLMDDPEGLFKYDGSAGSMGKIKSLADLPEDDILMAYFMLAADLNEQGVKATTPKTAPEKKQLIIPDDLIAAFKNDTTAMQHFEQFNYSAKKEYVDWLAEAKTTETRQKRLKTIMEWVAEGKTRYWKYK
jgi:uncharacterized protein YdeI (YjbR/CyaY-like superfamily)